MSKHHGKVVLCIGNDPVSLNLRCSLLKEHGWNVLSSGSGYQGVIRFGQEHADVVVLDLNDDGAESALIASQFKRLRPEVPVIMLVRDDKTLAQDATKQADAVILKSEESGRLVGALKTVQRT